MRGSIQQQLAAKGRNGDTMLAHINPQEAQLLKSLGGSGTINPHTGLPEFWGLGSITSAVSNAVKSVAAPVVDVAKGAVDTVKDVASSDLGKAALLAGGAYLAAPYLTSAAGSLGLGGAAPELLGEASGAWATSPAAVGAAGGAGLLGSAVNWASANPLAATGLGLTAAKALGGGSTPTSSTSSTAIDPEMKAAYLRNLEEARTTAAGLGQKQFADFSGNYTTAEQQLRNLGIGGAGQTGTAEAARLSALEAGYTPDQINAAQINRQAIANVNGGTGAQFMGAYQNPYENQVVQSALNDVELARQRAGLSDRAAATAAKAFGGSRQGVAEALTNEAALRNASSTAANLRSAGFTTAAQLGQSDAARMLQAQMANQGVDLSTLQANTSLAQQAALANQAANAQGAGIRLNAAGQMGNLAAQQQNLGIAGSNAVMTAEAQRQALEQAKLDAARNLSLERLGISQGALGIQPANLGGTTTTPIYKNQSASALGGALSGGILGNMIGGSTGAGYGAAAGGLLGLLG